MSIHQVKQQLSKVLRYIEQGNEVIITRRGIPIAKLLAIEVQSGRRNFGWAKGQVWISEDFDAPLPAEMLNVLYKA